MTVIILLLLVSICISGGFLAAFMWSIKDNQYEDENGDANRILFENNKSITK